MKKSIISSLMMATLLLSGVSAASANEGDSLTAKTAVEQVAVENLKDISSTNDDIRRNALEKEFGIKLSSSDFYDVRDGYTPKETLKKMGYYHVNANREELIKYAVRTGDWQPYRVFSAAQHPAYFEVVDGKYEYSKIFYGYLLEAHMQNYLAKYGEAKESAKADHERYLAEYLEKFRNAPGVVPYVVHINHDKELAEKFNVPMPDKDFFDSKYNNPLVMSQGKFSK